MLRPPKPENIYHKDPEPQAPKLSFKDHLATLKSKAVEVKEEVVESAPVQEESIEALIEEVQEEPEEISVPEEPPQEEPEPDPVVEPEEIVIPEEPQEEPIKEETPQIEEIKEENKSIAEEPAQDPADNKEVAKDWFVKPQGWNGGNKVPLYRPNYGEKKPGWGRIIWWGITDKDVDPKYARKYHNLLDTLKPYAIIAALVMLIFGYLVYSDTFKQTGNYKHDSYVDRVIDWLAEKYDRITGRQTMDSPQQPPAPDSSNNQKVDTLDTDVEPAPTADTTYEPVRQKVVVHDTFHYYRTDTVKKRVVVIDTILGGAPPRTRSESPPVNAPKSEGGKKMSHLDSILARTRGEIQ